MSPFSIVLRTLRARFSLGQGEFAARLGYRQTYISALECGTKLPKDEELVQKIVSALDLGQGDETALRRAYNISKRFEFPPHGVAAEAYALCFELSEALPALSSEEINTMRVVLDSVRRASMAAAISRNAPMSRALKEIPM